MFYGIPSLGNTATAESSAIPSIISLLLADDEEFGDSVLAVGTQHSCVILKDQTIRCWGSNTNGRLGNNSTENSAEPVAVVGLSGAVSVYAGFATTCATLESGTTLCWGESRTNILGSESDDDLLVPKEIPALENNLGFDAGRLFSCQIRPDKTVSCAGEGSDGQQGNGTRNDNAVYSPVSGITNASELELGQNHACVIVDNGIVKCWGRNSDGQTGLGNDDERRVLLPVTVPGISTATKLALTQSASCALLSNGTIKCWGNNSFGEIGNGSDNLEEFIPQFVSGITNAVAIVADDEHVCALLNDETVRCWGDNSRGVLNNGDAAFLNQNTPQLSQGFSNVQALGTGSDFKCVVTGSNSANRKLQCVGDNFVNQAGAPSFEIISAPTSTTSLPYDVSAIAAGFDHSCALYTTGQAACWGSNSFGQLGLGNLDHNPEPATISGLSNAVDIDAAGNTTCVVLDGGQVQCWGDGDNGELGNGATVDSASPVNVSNINSAIKVGVGQFHACAVLSKGTVECWGNNFRGQLGTTTVDFESSVPVAVDNVTTAVDVFLGSQTSCAILSDGKIHCWGSSQDGVIPPVDDVTPATVTGLENVTDMALDVQNGCAVDQGDLICWGRNTFGQLADPDIDKRTPTHIEELSDVVAVGLSDKTVCAATDDGNTPEVYCWGTNSNGNLGVGDESRPRSNVPLKVHALGSVDQFTYYGNHFCALSKPRTVSCWGLNTFGEIGNGTRGFLASPNDINLDLP